MTRKLASSLFMVFVWSILGFSNLLLAEAATSISSGICENDSTLVGCWQMNEGSGLTISDSGAETLHKGTLQGNPLWTVGFDGFKNAIKFNGLNQYISIPDADPLRGTTKMSISAWIKPEIQKNDIQTIIAKGEVNLADYSYELSLASADDLTCPNRVYYQVRVGASINPIRICSKTLFPINSSWIHVVGSYNGVDTRMKLYVNGAEEASMTTSYPSASVYRTFSSLAIAHTNTTSNKYYYKGTIDDVRIYLKELSASEVMQLTSGPTAVMLNSYTGDVDGNIVHLRWSTVNESNLVGFNLYRNSVDDHREVINDKLIPAKYPGQPASADYDFTDTVDLGQKYTYFLEFVKTDGNWLGPQITVETGFWLNLPFVMR